MEPEQVVAIHPNRNVTANEWEILDSGAGVRKYEYDFGGATANTFAVRLRPERWLVISPASRIPESALDELEGEVVALLAPNAYHHLGIETWLRHWPRARCFAAEAAIKRLGRKCSAKVEFEPLEALETLLPAHVHALVPPHLKSGEAVVRVRTGRGWLWCLTDILMNLRAPPSNWLLRALFWIFGARPGLRVNPFFRFLFIADRPRFRAWFLEQIERFPPVVVAVGHGDAVATDDVEEALVRIVNAGC